MSEPESPQGERGATRAEPAEGREMSEPESPQGERSGR